MDKIIDKDTQKRNSRKRLIRIACGSAIIIALIAGAILYTGGKTVRASDIKLSEAVRGPLETAVAASGKVVPAFEEIVNSPVSSRIMAVYAQPGDSVKEGMPLLELDLRATESQYKSLQDAYQIKVNELRQLKLANKSALNDLAMQVKIKEMEVNTLAIDVENEQRLDSLGSGTGERVRKARKAYDTARLELDALRQKLVAERERLAAVEDAAVLGVGNAARDLEDMGLVMSQGKIPAPHDGILTYLSNSIGSTVAAGEKVAVVGDLSRFKIEASVPEGSSYKVKPGATVIVRISTSELEGTVANVEPQAVEGAVPFNVTLKDASDKRLRSGLRTQVYVNYGYKESVVLIPNGEYYGGAGDYQMFVADGDKLVRRKVTLGDSNRQWVEVREGISPGEKVVTMNMEKYLNNKTLKLK